MGFKLSEIERNIVRLDLIGDFDAQDALEYPDQLAPFHAIAGSTGELLHMYVDTVKFKKLSVEGRRVFSAANKNKNQGKVATTGVNRILRMMARFVMVASGRSNIRFFDSESDALDWLRQSE